MILVILHKINIINFSLITIDAYKRTTHEQIDNADKYTLLINSFGYILLSISIIMICIPNPRHLGGGVHISLSKLFILIFLTTKLLSPHGLRL